MPTADLVHHFEQLQTINVYWNKILPDFRFSMKNDVEGISEIGIPKCSLYVPNKWKKSPMSFSKIFNFAKFRLSQDDSSLSIQPVIGEALQKPLPKLEIGWLRHPTSNISKWVFARTLTSPRKRSIKRWNWTFGIFFASFCVKTQKCKPF